MATNPSSDSAAIRQIIRALRNNGFILDTVYDGEDEPNVSNEKEAIAAIMAVGDSTLWVKNSETGKRSGVYFVLGNEPYEVACDWTIGDEKFDKVVSDLVFNWEG